MNGRLFKTGAAIKMLIDPIALNLNFQILAER